jgi:hypothetical protein
MTEIPESVVVEKNGKQTVLYEPFPHQRRFHRSTAKNCIMQGGAGSGKSLAMRWDAYMRCLAIPRFNALILRRTMPELRKSHLTEVPFDADALGLSKNAWHSTFYVLRFPNGSTVMFGHCEDEKTVATYLSSEYDAIYFDELATFSMHQFLFIASRARSTKPEVKGREIVRGGTNPIGVGAGWVRRFFITKQVHESEIPGYRPEDYEEIFCTVDDNPAVDESYKRTLMSLPSDALRRAMRYGEWVIEGQFFGEFEPTREGRSWHVIEHLPTYRGRPITEAPHIEIVRVIDWGYAAAGNPGACHWFACLPDGSAIAFQEWYFRETLPKDVATEVIRRSEGMRVRYTVGDPSMWQEHEGPSIAEHFSSAKLSMIEGDNEREPGWINVHNWLREVLQTGTTQYPRMRLLRDGVPTMIRTLPEMVINSTNPADMATTGVEDEAADNLRYFCQSRPGASRAPLGDVSPGVLDMLKKARARQASVNRWAPDVLRGV